MPFSSLLFDLWWIRFFAWAGCLRVRLLSQSQTHDSAKPLQSRYSSWTEVATPTVRFSKPNLPNTRHLKIPWGTRVISCNYAHFTKGHLWCTPPGCPRTPSAASDPSAACRGHLWSRTHPCAPWPVASPEATPSNWSSAGFSKRVSPLLSHSGWKWWGGGAEKSQASAQVALCLGESMCFSWLTNYTRIVPSWLGCKGPALACCRCMPPWNGAHRKIRQHIHQVSHCFRYRTCHQEGIASAMRRAAGVGYLWATVVDTLPKNTKFIVDTDMIPSKKAKHHE